MGESTLDYYLKAFARMNRATIRDIKAPHKPLLLLSILHLVRRGIIASNRITLSEELVREFKSLWAQYIGSDSHMENFMVSENLSVCCVLHYPFRCSIANPFYHLQHESFWRLVKSEDYVKRKDYTSIKQLRVCFSHAEMDEELFSFMAASESAKTIERNLTELIRQ